ncbi:TetR/AcrR family transcriptional regulator C-terminal domain-containing protein [Actinokineospora sp. 24-640]
MVVYAGQGDPARSLPLLWQVPTASTRPGPRQGLTVDGIVAAAIAIADADGLPAVSMRAVGERLGRTAMALYTYVPGKGELLELMYDRALAELPTSYPDPDWRAALTAWAADSLAFHLRHPWLLHISQARPVLGPNEFTSLETLAAILHRTGLTAGAARGAVGTLMNYVRGSAQTVTDARTAAEATGQSDEDWWYARSPILVETVPDFAERFPMVSWVESDGEQPPDDCTPYLEWHAMRGFHSGLSILLDGIAARQPR